jgi:hypothetical protein
LYLVVLQLIDRQKGPLGLTIAPRMKPKFAASISCPQRTSPIGPGVPLAKGKDAVRKMWVGMMGTPGFALTFVPTKVEVSRSGDLGYEIGEYEPMEAGKLWWTLRPLHRDAGNTGTRDEEIETQDWLI